MLGWWLETESGVEVNWAGGVNSGALSIQMVWKVWDWPRPPGVQAEVRRRPEGDGEKSLQGRLRRSHREGRGKSLQCPGTLKSPVMVLQ